MHISACISNSFQSNKISVSTNNLEKNISIPSKAEGLGSSVNGGELLFLALATCYCNDVYREAGKRSMDITAVAVKVWGEFGKEGEPATAIQYEVQVQSPNNTPEEIQELINYVDRVAEIHNTLRNGVSVTLRS